MSGLSRTAILGAMMAGAMSPLASVGNAMRSLTTTLPDYGETTLTSKRNGPGFTAAHVKRMAKKRRNQQRHKVACRGSK